MAKIKESSELELNHKKRTMTKKTSYGIIETIGGFVMARSYKLGLPKVTKWVRLQISSYFSVQLLLNKITEYDTLSAE